MCSAVSCEAAVFCDNEEMNYELAKKLEEAGFPQAGKGAWIGPPERLAWRSGDLVYVPTLEELMAECGEPYEFILKFHKECGEDKKPAWHAVLQQRDALPDHDWTKGQSPSEAVAHLWLAMHKV